MHLAADSKASPLDGFDLFGIIKETGVDDTGLEEFHKEYFPFPIYKDLNLEFYDAFGNGSVMAHVTFNPFKIFSGMKRMKNRLKEKKIEGNLTGEGLKTGGLIIFDNDGSPKFIAPEVTGSPWNEEELLASLDNIRKGGNLGEL